MLVANVAFLILPWLWRVKGFSMEPMFCKCVCVCAHQRCWILFKVFFWFSLTFKCFWALRISSISVSMTHVTTTAPHVFLHSTHQKRGLAPIERLCRWFYPNSPKPPRHKVFSYQSTYSELTVDPHGDCQQKHDILTSNNAGIFLPPLHLLVSFITGLEPAPHSFPSSLFHLFLLMGKLTQNYNKYTEVSQRQQPNLCSGIVSCSQWFVAIWGYD